MFLSFLDYFGGGGTLKKIVKQQVLVKHSFHIHLCWCLYQWFSDFSVPWNNQESFLKEITWPLNVLIQ